MRNNFVETIVGAIVIAIAVGFFVFSYRTADMGSVNGYSLSVLFDRADGISTGADVRMSGIKIGTVSGMSLDMETYYAMVTLVVDSGVALPSDSSAKITSEGLLGDSYIAIEAGGSQETMTDGDEIEFAQGSIDLMGLIGQAVFSAGGDS